MKKRAIRFGLKCDEELLKKRAERFKEQLGNNENIHLDERRKKRFSKRKLSGVISRRNLKKKGKFLKRRKISGKENFVNKEIGFNRRRKIRRLRRNRFGKF